MRKNIRGRNRIMKVRKDFGFLCVTFLYLMVIVSFFIHYTRLIPSGTNFYFKSFNIFFVFSMYVLTVVSHWKAWKNKKSQVSTKDFIEDLRRCFLRLPTDAFVPRCRSCGLYKAHRTHHCRVCNKCVLKMEHHCPWISNCIGLYNQKHFVLFNIYAFALSAYTFFLLILKFYVFLELKPGQSIFTFMGENHLAELVLAVFAVPTLAFTALLIIRQMWIIHHNITTIEMKTGERFYNENNRKNRINNYKEVFGSPISILWLSPFHEPNIDITKTKCLGFARNYPTNEAVFLD